jgi:hypothetical protein
MAVYSRRSHITPDVAVDDLDARKKLCADFARRLADCRLTINKFAEFAHVDIEVARRWVLQSHLCVAPPPIARQFLWIIAISMDASQLLERQYMAQEVRKRLEKEEMERERGGS